jgi:hypothetical protein
MSLDGAFCNFSDPPTCAEIAPQFGDSPNPTDQIVGRVAFLLFHAVPVLKVLRFFQAGHCNPPRLIRISRNLPVGSVLAVKGDVLIHGPNVVAWPMGSERRNHHRHQVFI